MNIHLQCLTVNTFIIILYIIHMRLILIKIFTDNVIFLVGLIRTQLSYNLKNLY